MGIALGQAEELLDFCADDSIVATSCVDPLLSLTGIRYLQRIGDDVADTLPACPPAAETTSAAETSAVFGDRDASLIASRCDLALQEQLATAQSRFTVADRQAQHVCRRFN